MFDLIRYFVEKKLELLLWFWEDNLLVELLFLFQRAYLLIMLLDLRDKTCMLLKLVWMIWLAGLIAAN